MWSDFDSQTNFVINNAWRLISLQDKEISSPSYGSFHYAYWRDKTSEFPDSRFQEAGATIGILSSTKYAKFHGKTLPSKDELYITFSAALKNLENIQYPDGSFDEWYKGERGFAATEFTSIAFGLAAICLGDELQIKEREILNKILLKSGLWLSKREDKVKSNHQAAGAAALSIIWKYTKNNIFLESAKKAVELTLKRQTSEGWFPEIGGMDLGYCSVLLDYLMIYVWITKDKKPIKPLKKLIKFMLPHIHPDGTISPESGICINPYVSRVGLCLFAQNSSEGSWILKLIEANKDFQKVLKPYLADDLRFCRWSHLPLFCDFLKSDLKFKNEKLKENYYPEGWTIRKNSSLAAYHNDKIHAYFSISGGGVIRVFNNLNLIFEEEGIVIRDKKMIWNTKGYKKSRNIYLNTKVLGFVGELHIAKYAFPNFLSRTILRILCINPLLSKFTRDIIDSYRLKNSSAINQSAASISRDSKNIVFKKEISIDENNMFLSYEIDKNKYLSMADEILVNYSSKNHIIKISKFEKKILIIFQIKLLGRKKIQSFRKVIDIKNMIN